MICNNCNSSVEGDYCNKCGQRTSVNQVTFSETFQDFINAVFSINAPFFITIKLLVINPGKLFREYLAGKRKAYYKPVAFFILWTIVYVVVLSVFDFNAMDKVFPKKTNIDFNIWTEGSKLAYKNTKNLLFIYVFTTAFFIKVFFNKKYSLAEYTAVSFYLISVYTIFLIITTPITKYTNLGFQMISSWLMLFYMLYGMISFFEKKNFATIIKIIVLHVISIVLFFFIGFFISVLIVWLINK
jgi:hypothetical protein